MCSNLSLENFQPANDASALLASSVEITGQRGVLETNTQYQFSIQTVGDIPREGFFTLTIPAGVGVPANPATFALNCILGC